MRDENKTVTIPHYTTLPQSVDRLQNCVVITESPPLSSDAIDHFNKMHLLKCENFVVDIRCPIIPDTLRDRVPRVF